MGRYLVTGIAGFIGSYIARSLILRGEQVSGIDNLSTGSVKNLSPFLHAVRLYQGDIRDEGLLARAMEGMDCVFHLAAVASVQQCTEYPVETEAINLTATLRIIEMARKQNVRRIVFSSSSAIYGAAANLPISEVTPPAPLSPYARHKMAAEEALRAASKSGDLETVSLRYFNVFGPRQSSSSPYSGVIARFIRLMLSPDDANRAEIFGNGEQTRDFVYIQDVVAANLAAADAPAAEVSGKAFNVATGVAHSINQVADIIAEKTGYLHGVVHVPARAGEVCHSQADITSARRCLAYEPSVSFADGLGKTIDWYRTQTSSADRNLSAALPASIASLRQREREGLVEDLREAVACGNFDVIFQPILSASDGRLKGAEALLRWQNRGRNIPTKRFIPLAEEIGVIDKLGTWVIRHACVLLSPLFARLDPDFRISVNVSPSQLESGEICTVIRNALREANVAPHQFEIEITERGCVHDLTKIGRTLDQIHRMGVSIALDDFGAGYSNMESLCRLKLNRIKIDRSMSTVSRAQLPVFEGIVQMARRLGISAVAEGIESLRQLERARAAGCDEVQGFFLAKPVVASQLPELAGGRRVVASAISSAIV